MEGNTGYSSRRFLAACALIVTTIALATASLIAGCAPAPPTMKVVAGENAEEAVNDLLAVNKDFDITVHTELGTPINVDGPIKLSDFHVVSTTPSQGEVIEGDSIDVCVKESLPSSDVAGWVKSAFGVGRCEFYDDGALSIVRVYVSGSLAADLVPDGDDINEDTRDANAGLFQEWANEIKHDVVIGLYTEDGFLYTIACVPYSGSTQEQQAFSAACAEVVASEADEYAKGHWEPIVDKITKQYGSMAGCKGAEWRDRFDDLEIYVYADVDDPSWIADTPAELDDIKRQNRGQANWLTYLTRKNASILFYSNQNQVWDKYSDTKHPWLPESVTSLAATCENPPSSADIMYTMYDHSASVELTKQ